MGEESELSLSGDGMKSPNNGMQKSVFRQLQRVARQIPLPSEKWCVAMCPNQYLVFAKTEDDLSTDLSVCIKPDLSVEVMLKHQISRTYHLSPNKKEDKLAGILETVDKICHR